MGFFSRVVRNEIPAPFFTAVAETVDAVFVSAHRRAVAEGRVLPVQVPYARGNDRHYAVQRGIVDVAVSLGGEDFTTRIGRSGYPMPLVRMGRTVIATCIADNLDHLRRSDARLQLASQNKIFEPRQPSFWDDDDGPPLEDFRFAMLLIAKPHKDADQSLPAGVFFGMPTTSLRSWHFYNRVDEIRAMYDEADWAETPPMAERRYPRLRGASHSINGDDTGTEG